MSWQAWNFGIYHGWDVSCTGALVYAINACSRMVHIYHIYDNIYPVNTSVWKFCTVMWLHACLVSTAVPIAAGPEDQLHKLQQRMIFLMCPWMLHNVLAKPMGWSHIHWMSCNSLAKLISQRYTLLLRFKRFNLTPYLRWLLSIDIHNFIGLTIDTAQRSCDSNIIIDGIPDLTSEDAWLARLARFYNIGGSQNAAWS